MGALGKWRCWIGLHSWVYGLNHAAHCNCVICSPRIRDCQMCGKPEQEHGAGSDFGGSGNWWEVRV